VKWFNQEPVDYLGVIVYLAYRRELHILNQSLLLLRQHLPKPRPVVIFHENDLDDINIQLDLAKTLGSNVPLGFEHIRFPTQVSRMKELFHRICRKYVNHFCCFHLQVNITYGRDGYHVGYHHMCRLFAIMLPYHPLFTNMFTFYWRLDSDSYLLGPPLVDDIFVYMKERYLQYAFVMVDYETPKYVEGLWELFHQFLTGHDLMPSAAIKKIYISLRDEIHSFSIFYNNFEVANASMWRAEPRIAAWLHQVDESGGIYRRRWGDAPIRTLAIIQFLERNQVIKITDLGYFHKRGYRCANGVDPCMLPAYLQVFNSRHFPNGCNPINNTLCQHYPEKRWI
jgi:hypothetical protein